MTTRETHLSLLLLEETAKDPTLEASITSRDRLLFRAGWNLGRREALVEMTRWARCTAELNPAEEGEERTR